MLTLLKKRSGPPNLPAPIRWLVILAIAFLASFAGDLCAQTQLATVFGTVTDPTGAVIPGAQIKLVNQSTGLKRDTVTDMAGEYHLVGLPTVNYSLRIEKAGFQSQIREGVELTPAAEVLAVSRPYRAGGFDWSAIDPGRCPGLSYFAPLGLTDNVLDDSAL